MIRTTILLILVNAAVFVYPTPGQEAISLPPPAAPAPSFHIGRTTYTPGWTTFPCSNAASAPSFAGAFHAVMAAQVSNGVRRRLTLHRYDFDTTNATVRLNAHGRARLRRFAAISRETGLPIIVEADLLSPAQAMARHNAALKAYAEIDPLVPAEQVVVGLPAPRLVGDDLSLINQTRRSNTENRGPTFGQSIGN